MTKIGLVPMSAKPLHAGHWGLINIAASENDEVHLFVSLSDRDNISGAAMGKIWKELIEPILPGNVKIEFPISPVGAVFKELGDADESGSQDVFSVYSDPEDTTKNYKTLGRYAGNLIANDQVKMRPIERTSTVNVSGTQMRQWFDADDKQSFINHLPNELDGNKVWDILKSASTTMSPAKKTTKRLVAKPPAKKPPQSESLLRSYVRLILGI